MYSDKILTFLSSLDFKGKLPRGIKIMNPYKDKDIFSYCQKFYSKYYKDNSKRALIVGINPGRFGGGLTGIPFTDPVKLEKLCGIKNELPKKTELSADFIYQMINAYGGNKNFYSKYYFSSICPLGFTLEGKNYNYYDKPDLLKAVEKFVIKSLEAQLDFGMERKFVYCLGEGKNFQFLSKLNSENQYFKHIIPLAHPRFIMQYKRKKLRSYVDNYLQKLSQPDLFIP